MLHHRPIFLKIVLPLFIGVLSLIGISILRKSSPKVIISAVTLHKTHASWTNRTFIDCTDSGLLKEAIGSKMADQPLDAQQRSAAEADCATFIQSISTRDWDEFQRVRLPLPSFKVSDEVSTALTKYSGLSANTNSIDHYRALWVQTFHEKPLFTGVSFVSNSVTILHFNTFLIGKIPFPEFVSKQDQNWLQVTPTVAFDYSSVFENHVSIGSPLTLLRFFFFAKCPDPEGARPFMLIFLWDHHSNRWIPWELTHASVRPTTHKLRFF